MYEEEATYHLTGAAANSPSQKKTGSTDRGSHVCDGCATGPREMDDFVTAKAAGSLAPTPAVCAREIEGIAELDQHVKRRCSLSQRLVALLFASTSRKRFC